MFRTIVILIFVVLYFQKFTYVDLSNYQSDEIKVEINGEVHNPDTYIVPYDSTIDDLIKIANGISEKANLESINLNQILKNNDVIVIPQIQNQESKKISINSATIEELSTLPGIGPAMAQRIIDYRNNQSFQKIEDIMNVKGIKEKLFMKIKDYITL